MFVAWCSLSFVVRCELLVIVCCVSFVAYSSLFVVCRLLVGVLLCIGSCVLVCCCWVCGVCSL